MQVLVAHPGTQHGGKLACELAVRGLLAEFWTGFAIGDGSMAARTAEALRSIRFLRGVCNRVVCVPTNRLHSVPFNDLRALWRMRRGQDGLKVLYDRNQCFQESVPCRSLQACDVVVGFDTSSWRLADRARALNRQFILDRSIAHPAALSRVEREMHRLYPAWCPPPRPRLKCLVAAELQEHQLAQRIVVGGSFARDSLLAEGIPLQKIIVNPYGVDWDRFSGLIGIDANRPLRFLFLGSHLARKGLPLLIDAWESLRSQHGDTELWLAGPCGRRERGLIPDLPGLRVLGQVARLDIPRLLSQTDVLVLPSLFEGFGLVLLEALAAGMPFIATPHTGAIDLPMKPQFGTIVPVGSVEALRAALKHYIDQPPDRSLVLSSSTLLRKHFSWSAYGDRWEMMLREIT